MTARRTVIGGDRLPPLEFGFWSVQPEIVVDNVARYAAEVGEHVICLETPGDYERVLGETFSASLGPHAFYAQRAEASLWFEQGHIAPLADTHSAVAPLLARMDPRLVAGARHHDGRLIGLTYYNGGPFMLFVHDAFARHVNFSALASWHDLLDQLRRLKRDGLSSHPYVPRWHSTQTGLVWSLLCHLATEGVFDLATSPAREALRSALSFFQALVDEDLVPPASLSDRGDSAAVERWATGGHVLSFTMDYLAVDAREAAGKPVNIPVERLPGHTGTPLMPGQALLCIRAGLEAELQERATRLLAYLGGTAPDGSLRVHARWLSERLFAVPYGELDAQSAVRDAMKQAFPPATADACLDRLLASRRAAVVSPPTHAPRFLEWSAFCDRTVRDDFLRTRRIPAAEAAADTLLAHWSALSADRR